MMKPNKDVINAVKHLNSNNIMNKSFIKYTQECDSWSKTMDITHHIYTNSSLKKNEKQNAAKPNYCSTDCCFAE